LNPPNLVIETIKRAEDNKGIIVRLFESQLKRGFASLKLVFQVKVRISRIFMKRKGKKYQSCTTN
jgi:alpha-mannosidase